MTHYLGIMGYLRSRCARLAFDGTENVAGLPSKRGIMDLLRGLSPTSVAGRIDKKRRRPRDATAGLRFLPIRM